MRQLLKLVNWKVRSLELVCMYSKMSVVCLSNKLCLSFSQSLLPLLGFVLLHVRIMSAVMNLRVP